MTRNTERLSPDRQLSRQDVECLKEAFKLFDCDSNGRITVEELGKVDIVHFFMMIQFEENRCPFASVFCTHFCFHK